MFNCAAVKKWKWSVALFLSRGAKSIADAESFREMLLHWYVSPHTTVLRKIDMCSCKKAAWKSPKTVGKDSGCESKGLHCVYRQKDTCIQTGTCELHFLKNMYQLSIATWKQLVTYICVSYRIWQGSSRMIVACESMLTHTYGCMPTRGVWGHAPPPSPRKIFEFRSSQIASDAIWDKITV